MPRADIPWGAIRDEYVFNPTTSLRGLAKKHGLSPKSLERRCKADGWVEDRRNQSAEVGQLSRARIREAAVEDRARIYDAIHEAVGHIVNAILRAAQDADQFFTHICSYERSNAQQRDRGVEERTFNVINGRNLADTAKALCDIVGVARTIDGIIDAATLAKLQIERERLELDRRKAGFSDDVESESGIALMPAVDQSLLDNALPDPDQNV